MPARTDHPRLGRAYGPVVVVVEGGGEVVGGGNCAWTVIARWAVWLFAPCAVNVYVCGPLHWNGSCVEPFAPKLDVLPPSMVIVTPDALFVLQFNVTCTVAPEFGHWAGFGFTE
jgi:hypothetical protein